MRMAPIVLDDCKIIVEDTAPAFQALAGKRVLITGASGFLMSYLVDVMAAWNALGRGDPVKVVALDNLKTGRSERLEHLAADRNFEFVQHDVTVPFNHGGRVDYIVHGASIASPMVYRKFPLETIDANVGGTRNMLELACKNNVAGMLVMSSSEIYGDPDPAFIPTPEGYAGNVMCMGPRACYDESKRMSETLSYVYHQLHKLPVVLIRPFNVYGPGFRLDDKRVLPDFFSAVLQRAPIVLHSDGRPTRTFCYVTDAIRAMLRLLVSGKGGEAFNVGNDEGEISMGDLARLTSKVGQNVMGGKAVAVEMHASDDAAYLTHNPQRRCPDLSKLRQETDWKPVISLEEGLTRTLTSYRQLGLGVD